MGDLFSEAAASAAGGRAGAARAAAAAADAGRVRRAGARARRGVGAPARDRGGPGPLVDLLRAARHAGRRRSRASSPRRRAAAFEELSAVSATVKDVREVLARGARAARHRRPAHDSLPRRDPPLQQGAAGRAAAGGRGGPRDADRRDDGEPVLRGELGAALAHAGVRARVAARPEDVQRSSSAARPELGARARSRRSSSS